MSRPRHPNKHIEKAVRYAESLGWRVKISRRGHAWGHLLCPHRSPEGCFVPVWSTPKQPEDHARHIWREVDLCPHYMEITDEDTPVPEPNDDDA